MHYAIFRPEGAARGDVTLVNGFTRSGSDFKAMARFLSEKGWRVFVPDNRGSGQSEGTAGFTLEDLAADLVRMWDENAVVKSHLLGISFGGAVSMTTAFGYPDRVASLVLVSTIPKWKEEGWRNSLFQQGEAEQAKNLERYFSPTFREAKGFLVKALTKEMSKSFREPEKVARAEAQLQAVRKFDATGKLERLIQPTLVLHGADDTVAPVDGARELAKKIPGATLDLISGIGHLFLAEAPKLLYEKAAAFWDGL